MKGSEWNGWTRSRMTLTGFDCTTPTNCRPWGWTGYHCTFPITRSPSKRRKLKKVVIIKAHIGSLLYNSMDRQQLRKPRKKNMQQQLVTSSLFDVETYSQSDVVDRVVGSSLSSLKDESSQDSDFIPELWQETLPPPKYGRQRVETDDCVSWEKITFLYNFSKLVNHLDWSWLVALLVYASYSFPKTLYVS